MGGGRCRRAADASDASLAIKSASKLVAIVLQSPELRLDPGEGMGRVRHNAQAISGNSSRETLQNILGRLMRRW